MSFKSTIFAATALLASAQAHIIMSSPVPYSVDKIDNSPITQSQFPCKSQNGFTVSTMNNMAVGEKQTIKFKGTAVHGGGSCQLSVTMDTNPTPDSVFKVIKSIEGGCPGVDGKTNEYDFELPDSIPNGKATFAWTWFSKMSGAPELYMNCAPIEVSGGASDKTKFEALPDMAVMNIGEGCTSPQNFATQFTNPGSVVQNGGTNDLKPPTGNCGSGTSPAPSSPAGSPSSPSGTSPAGQPSSAPQSSAPASPSVPAGGAPSAPSASSAPSAPPSNPGGVFAPGASGTPTSTTLVTVTAAPTPAQPTVPASGGTGTPAAPSSPSTGGGSAPSTPGAGGATGTCSSNGAVVCNGEKQFGLCNNGQVVWQDVASGTACVNGVISKRSLQGRVARPRYNRKVAV
jgi:hypothetical protein